MGVKMGSNGIKEKSKRDKCCCVQRQVRILLLPPEIEKAASLKNAAFLLSQVNKQDYAWPRRYGGIKTKILPVRVHI
jgi:hypothetical protein